MRKIKFRAWDNKHRCFDETVAANLLLQLHEPSEDIDPEYGKRFLLEEFTGLKDKNGVEIFEGDIILMDNTCIVQVVFGLHSIGKDSWDIEHASPMFCGKFKDDSGYTGLDFPEGYEVLGNIH